jgi:hypothetical protein
MVAGGVADGEALELADGEALELGDGVAAKAKAGAAAVSDVNVDKVVNVVNVVNVVSERESRVAEVTIRGRLTVFWEADTIEKVHGSDR